jgi:hypothetical protein
MLMLILLKIELDRASGTKFDNPSSGRFDQEWRIPAQCVQDVSGFEEAPRIVEEDPTIGEGPCPFEIQADSTIDAGDQGVGPQVLLGNPCCDINVNHL